MSQKSDSSKEKKGIFIVIDGIDGVGKGIIERALIEYEQKQGRAVFDTIAFSRAHRKGLPELKDFWNPPETYFDTIVTAEPTHIGIGHVIRNEIIERNERHYPARIQIESYSIDRIVNMKRLVIPALKNGLRVIQSRSVASTLTYQLLKAKEEGLDPETIKKIILEHPGNKLQLAWAPDLIIIPTIKNMNELMERIRSRAQNHKDDKAIFDNAEFQGKINSLYKSDWLRKLFVHYGSTVKYLDASISVEHTRQQAIDIYKEFLDSCSFAN